ncbi:hypothetical protein F2Q68_00000748 [Brassica cretica]|uniref:Uncharacterized protein n=1 Tax=Brassica cretica TaxID=69181 RepID=A0A8S9JKS7_BRACR|nr:hypothetical protein F2Q68_00000748 [Brassica cretica]
MLLVLQPCLLTGDSLMLQAKPTPLSISTYLSILPPMMLKDSTESYYVRNTLETLRLILVIFFMGFELLIYCTELLLNDQERDYILTRVHAAKEELKMKRKKTVKERYRLKNKVPGR